MMQEGYEQMRALLSRIELAGKTVLDVGAQDVNGTLRPLIEERGAMYIGLDVVAGPNVDIVSPDPYAFPLPDNTYDVVVSAYTFEHVPAFWRWLPELVRVLRPGGWLAVITHHTFPFHRYPVDCWRAMPDGLLFLLQEVGLRDIEVSAYSDFDISGWGRK